MYKGSIGKGIGLAVAAIVVAAFVAGGLATVAESVAIALFFGIGVAQAVWIVPLWIMYHRRGETETTKGLLIAAAIVFLLNAGCWGFVASLR